MSNNFLTRDMILGLQDITTKEITLPSSIPVWGNQKLYIRQLTRGEQDEYLKRQFGSMRAEQQGTGKKGSKQVMSAPDLYGHDAWVFVHSVCDEGGTLLFGLKDIDLLNRKSGEAIGYVAKEVLKFSRMDKDVEELDEVEADIKN